MAQRVAFGRNLGSADRRIKLVALVGFMCLMTLAIGVPLIGSARKVELPVQVEPTPLPEIDVFLPVQRIGPGTPLTLSMFKKERMNAIAVSALGGQILRSEADFLGKYAKTTILPGRPLMGDSLADVPENVILRKIKPGFRAVTLKLDDVTGIEGWSAPGARVDVLWITEQGGKGTIVTTIVKNVQVLSVMGKTDTKVMETIVPSSVPQRSTSAPQVSAQFTVTLLVSPDEGQKIMLANASGKLSLMLRGEFDNGQDAGATEALTTKRLLGEEGIDSTNEEQMEGTAKIIRDDGTVDEWSVIKGKVWKWDRGVQPEH